MPDNLTPAQRSYCMSRVRGRDTTLERLVRSALHRRGLRFRTHVAALPGRPDLVFPGAKVAVFLDGDFWHGYRFAAWSASLTPFWRTKIEKSRRRDRLNFRRLRYRGWSVLRVWGHSIERDLAGVVARIEAAARAASGAARRRSRDASSASIHVANGRGP